MKPVENGHAAFDQAAMVLGEISDGGFVSPDHFTGIDERAIVATGFAEFGFGRGGRIRQDGIDQRGLPCSVAAHERNAFAAGDAGGEIADDFLVAVGFAQVFDFENVFSAGTLLLELDIRPCDVRLGEFRYLQAFHFFAAGLDLAGTGSGGEAGNEFV